MWLCRNWKIIKNVRLHDTHARAVVIPRLMSSIVYNRFWTWVTLITWHKQSYFSLVSGPIDLPSLPIRIRDLQLELDIYHRVCPISLTTDSVGVHMKLVSKWEAPKGPRNRWLGSWRVYRSFSVLCSMLTFVVIIIIPCITRTVL